MASKKARNPPAHHLDKKKVTKIPRANQRKFYRKPCIILDLDLEIVPDCWKPTSNQENTEVQIRTSRSVNDQEKPEK